MKWRNGFLLSLVLVLSGPGLCASPSASSRAADPPDLAGRVAALVQAFEASSKGAQVGVSVVDVATGKTLAARREADLFLPASNQKLLTSAAILARLGGAFQFETRLHQVGKDLWVIGAGDPTSGDPLLAEENKTTIYAELDRWAAAAKARLTGCVEGDLVLVPCFGLENKQPQGGYRHPDWPKNQYHTWYCAPVAGLNFNNNCLDVTLVAGGGKIRPVISPTSKLIQIVDSLSVGGKGYWGLKYNADDSVVTVTGTARAANSEAQSIAVNDPPLLFGRVLADRLERAGCGVRGKVRVAGLGDVPPVLGTPLAVTATPLGVAMARANKRSLNMVAECMFLRAGDGTWAGSAKIVAQTLAKEYGADPAMLQIADGGGLGRLNKVAPAAMTKILLGVLKRPDCLTLVQSMPFGGMDGTMAKRLTEPAYRGRVIAKTGYIAGVSSLSGYILDKQNRCVTVYSILCNKVAGAAGAKKLEEDICKLLVDAVGK